MKEITLSGDYREMGRQHGEACRRQINLFTEMVQVMTGLSERPGPTSSRRDIALVTCAGRLVQESAPRHVPESTRSARSTRRASSLLLAAEPSPGEVEPN